MKSTKIKVRVKTTPYILICEALDSAIQSGMNKTDKYCEHALTEAQRDLPLNRIGNYFWVNIEEAGIEFQ